MDFIPTYNNDIERGYYLHGKKLGEGGFGVVKLATHLYTNQQVAIKIIDKQKVGDDLFRVQTEIAALSTLKHKNIAKLLQVMDNSKYIYLVLELCSGGELFDYLYAHKKLPEIEVKKIIRSLARVLGYIHNKGFAHRDIKPENILLDGQRNIKLIDFGLAASSSINGTLDGLKTACGSPAYVAPELLKGGGYSGPCADVWSTGVLMYTLLTGNLPFYDKSIAITYKKIKSGTYDAMRVADKDARDLIKQMINIDPKKRITVQGILSHPWLNAMFLSNELTKLEEEETEINEEVLFKCANSLSIDYDDIAFLRDKVQKEFSYETATYLLMKANPSKHTDHRSPSKAALSRRRSRSFSDFLTPQGLGGKRREPFVTPIATPKIPTTEGKPKILLNKNAIDSKPPINKKLFTDEIISKPTNCLSVRKQVKDLAPICKRIHVVNTVKEDKENFKLEYKDTPKKGKSLVEKRVVQETPTKKSLLKRFLESATPRKNSSPRRFNLNGDGKNDLMLKNITRTNYRDIEECKAFILRVMSARHINCTIEKNFTIRCVLSSRNEVLLVFELELLICHLSGCIGINRKRIRGNSWDYLKICEDLQKAAQCPVF